MCFMEDKRFTQFQYLLIICVGCGRAQVHIIVEREPELEKQPALYDPPGQAWVPWVTADGSSGFRAEPGRYPAVA